MKIRKFNENVEEQRTYLDVPINTCPVCGEEVKIEYWSSTFEEEGFDGDFDSIFLDYKCKVCDFKWYSEFTFKQQKDLANGEEIITGKSINPNSYNPMKLFSKRYNI